MITKKDIINRIVQWLLNGVTEREIQERLGWLGFSYTIEEINEIGENL